LVKYKSETLRKGEPDDHEYAVHRVCMWLADNYVKVGTLKNGSLTRTYTTTKIYYYPPQFRTHKDYPDGHKPDITLVEYDRNDDENYKGFIEIDGRMGGTYFRDGKKLKYTPTKHDSKPQKKNDKIFERYVEEYYNVPVIRLLKEEILTDDKKVREYYLKKNLKVLLK
jgi:hypothetical protein